MTRTTEDKGMLLRRIGTLHVCPTCDLDAALDVKTHPSHNRPRPGTGEAKAA